MSLLSFLRSRNYENAENLFLYFPPELSIKVCDYKQFSSLKVVLEKTTKNKRKSLDNFMEKNYFCWNLNLLWKSKLTKTSLKKSF